MRSTAALPALPFLPLALAVLLGACDSAPGRTTAPGRLPIVTSVAATPADVVVEELPAADVTATTVRVRLAVAATARDPEGALDRVSYALYPLTPSALPLVAQRLRPTGGDAFAADTTLTLPRTGLGTYTLRVYALDAEGQLGEGQTRLVLRSRNRAPALGTVAASPNPYPGTGALVLTAEATDPDGTADLDRVEATFAGTTFRLFDDGATSGDATAGDGRYTATILFSERPAAGTYPIAFVAIDRQGARSATAQTSLVIQ